MFSKKLDIKKELSEIEDIHIRNFTEEALLHAPSYFWTQESSKKHHPKDERKKGGRVLHARRAAKIA